MENIVPSFQRRQCLHNGNLEFSKFQHVSLPLARRLGLEKELQHVFPSDTLFSLDNCYHGGFSHMQFIKRSYETYEAIVSTSLAASWLDQTGHDGCVNSLQWSDCGEFLASGSDDLKVVIWDVVKRRLKEKIDSGHSGNIFTVKFMPSSNNGVVASGAADCVVKVHDTKSKQILHNYTCHSNRIKRLAVSKQSPFLLWSGGEDGTVREFDLRTPHKCSSNIPCRNVVVDLNDHASFSSRVKCIQLHPYRSEVIAVGAEDPYVRLYDRRKLSLKQMSESKTVRANTVKDSCMSYYAPGHLVLRDSRTKKYRRDYSTTYIAFSPDGRELLQNLGGEHIFLYSLNGKRDSLVYTADFLKSHACSGNSSSNNNEKLQATNTYKNGFSKNGLNSTYAMRISTRNNSEHSLGDCSCDDEHWSRYADLPEKASRLKEAGNDAFSKYNYFQAVVCYNRALKYVPNSSVLYANRGAALLKRAWDGDIYAALRDCQVSVQLDPTHSKAYYRQARCLFELEWLDEADVCLQRFKELFPDQADSSSVRSLQSEILKKRSTGTVRNNLGDINDRTLNHDERVRRNRACDYDLRFVGSCNTRTDIKEVNFFGKSGQFIMAGSDCGCMLMWDKTTTNLIEAWQGDDNIVNCIQPHPTSCLVATSGLDPVVRLWSPCPVEGEVADRRAKEVEELARANQKRMKIDPLTEILRDMVYANSHNNDTSDEDPDDGAGGPMECIQS